MDKIIKLRLTADVDYVIDSTREASEVVEEQLKQRLRAVIGEAYGVGVLTDDLGAYVQNFHTKIEKID